MKRTGINKEKYLKIKEKLGKKSNFVLFDGEKKLIKTPNDEDINKMHVNVVLLGLYIYKDGNNECLPNNLKSMIHGTSAEGAYLTDILEQQKQTVCDPKQYLNKNPRKMNEVFEKLKEELEYIGFDKKKCRIICLGSSVYRIAMIGLGIEYRLKKVCHYSSGLSVEHLKCNMRDALN